MDKQWEVLVFLLAVSLFVLEQGRSTPPFEPDRLSLLVPEPLVEAPRETLLRTQGTSTPADHFAGPRWPCRAAKPQATVPEASGLPGPPGGTTEPPRAGARTHCLMAGFTPRRGRALAVGRLRQGEAEVPDSATCPLGLTQAPPPRARLSQPNTSRPPGLLLCPLLGVQPRSAHPLGPCGCVGRPALQKLPF